MGNSASGDQDQHHCDGAGGGAGVAVVDWCRVLSVGDDGKRMGYDAAMELQTQIDELKAKVSQLEALLDGGNPRFDTITCKGWRVIDEESKVRIAAASVLDGFVGVVWLVKDKARIMVGTSAHGNADVGLLDKDGKHRILASTQADGTVILPEERTKNLEARSKWQTLAICALAMVVVFMVKFAVKPYGIITCDGWQIVDKDGTVRIRAVTYTDGQAGVELFDKDEKLRISAGVSANGTVELPTKDLKPK